MTRVAAPAWLLLISLLVASTGGATAHAQPARQGALARKLFEEGVALGDHGDWAGAEERFRRAHALKPTSGIAYNWANALAELGKLVAAQELLRAVDNDDSASAALKRESRALSAALSGRIAHLRVRVVGADDPAFRVSIDDEDWPRDAWDVEAAIDPGDHTVVLTERGAERARTNLVLAEAEQREIVLRAPVPRVESSSVSADSRPGPAARDDAAPRAPRKRWIWWAAAGVVVLGGATAAVVLATRKDAKGDAPVQGNAIPGVLRW